MNKGQHYRHNKTKRVYEIAAIAMRESDLEPVAIYFDISKKDCKNCLVLWSRPIVEFDDIITDDLTGSQFKRFELIK